MRGLPARTFVSLVVLLGMVVVAAPVAGATETGYRRPDVLGPGRSMDRADGRSARPRPTVETIEIDDTHEEFSAPCGFRIVAHDVGTVTVRTWQLARGGFREVSHIRIDTTLTNVETGQVVRMAANNQREYVERPRADGSIEVTEGFTGLNYRTRGRNGIVSAGSQGFTYVLEPGAVFERYVGGHDHTLGLLHTYPILCVLLGATDSDNDFLPDSGGFRSEALFGTDPHDPDSDGDGWKDGIEVANERAPLNPAHRPGRGVGDIDEDDDGLPDGLEVLAYGAEIPGPGTDPLDPDTDDDGISDLDEFVALLGGDAPPMTSAGLSA